MAVDRQADAPVLRRALLGDVELGHDLDAGHEAGHEVAGHGRGVEHDAVHAEAHAHVVRTRLEVDVRRASTHRIGDHRVHELHHRRVVRGLAQLDDLGLLLDVVDLVDRARERSEVLDQRVDVLGRGDRSAHLVARGHRDVVEREQVGGIRGCHEQRLLGEEGDGNRPVSARLGAVDHAGGALVHVENVEVHVVEAVALRERLGELPGVHEARLDQCLPERHAVGVAVVDHLLHALTLGKAELNDHVADPTHDAGALGGRGQAWDGERFGGWSLSFHTVLISAAVGST